MNTTQDAPAGSFWKYLITPEKRATLQLEQLCKGLAEIIRTKIIPGLDEDLTPARLSTFYHSIGGDYDHLLLSNAGLSKIYTTTGCFHDLKQPPNNPFAPPATPCLSNDGFVRWTTIQLLLTPHNDAPLLQRAVQVYDIPNPDGGFYPKHIPSECLPQRPDDQMLAWYNHVCSLQSQENYMNLRRLKNSPYVSPYPEIDRGDGYFGRVPQIRQPRRTSSDEEARAAEYRRRSSVPDLASPPIGDRRSHWDSAQQDATRKTRSHSAHRSKDGNRQRSHTLSVSPQIPSPLAQLPSRSPIPHPPPRLNGSRLPSADQRRPPRSSHGFPSSPSTIDESASDASSEASPAARRQGRRSRGDEQERRSSFWPSFLSPAQKPHHKRRHSSETQLRKRVEPPPLLPPRPEVYHVNTTQPQYAVPAPPPAFRHPNFGKPRTMPTAVNEVSPTVHFPPGQPQSTQYPAPRNAHLLDTSSYTIGQPLTRENSNSSDRRNQVSFERQGQRNFGPPLRVATVTGVNGRPYANVEPQSVTAPRRNSHGVRSSLATMA